MRDEVKYINHKGQTINLNGDGVYANYKESLSYAYELRNGRNLITNKNFEMLVVTTGGGKTINRMVDILNTDTINNQYGKLYINGWYIRCQHTGLPSVIGYDNALTKVSFSFYAPSFEFTKSRLIMLSEGDAVSTEKQLDFDFDFDFDMSGMGIIKSTFINEHALPADFVLRFKAPIGSVEINIGNNIYIVDESINTGETFVINTEEKRVYKEGESGITDLFNKSSDEYDIFAKIPSGEQVASWVGNFPLSLLLLEHRSVPLWI